MSVGAAWPEYGMVHLQAGSCPRSCLPFPLAPLVSHPVFHDDSSFVYAQRVILHAVGDGTFFNRPPKYKVGQAFQPDARPIVRLESLIYSVV